MEMILAVQFGVGTLLMFAILLVALVLVVLGVAINSTKYVGIGAIVLIVGLLLVEVLPK
jgi:hypothetical protein